MRRDVRALPTLAFAATLVALAACAPTPDRTRSTRAALPTSGGNPFAAVELRIHPLTRVVPDSPPGSSADTPPGPQIEAHIELLDTFGAVVRDIGVFRFELFRGLPGVDPEAAPASAIQELVWTIDLSDPSSSAQQFDRITNTYVIPLPGAPDWLFSGDPATLRVEFTTPDERRIVATRRLRTR